MSYIALCTIWLVVWPLLADIWGQFERIDTKIAALGLAVSLATFALVAIQILIARKGAS
jgi:hypothetical protein